MIGQLGLTCHGCCTMCWWWLDPCQSINKHLRNFWLTLLAQSQRNQMAQCLLGPMAWRRSSNIRYLQCSQQHESVRPAHSQHRAGPRGLNCSALLGSSMAAQI